MKYIGRTYTVCLLKIPLEVILHTVQQLIKIKSASGIIRVLGLWRTVRRGPTRSVVKIVLKLALIKARIQERRHNPVDLWCQK